MKAKQIQSYDIPLHDIKPLVEVQEYSIYYFLGAVSIAVVVLILLAYLLYIWNKKRNAFNIRKVHIKLLREINLDDTKQSAYAITTYGATFKDDSPRHVEMFNNLTTRLEVYKYKKEVDKFDSEVLGYIELYKGMIDA